MAAAKSSKQAAKRANDEGGKFVARNLAAMNPRKEQFAPTPAEPVRQHARMAGAC